MNKIVDASAESRSTATSELTVAKDRQAASSRARATLFRIHDAQCIINALVGGSNLSADAKCFLDAPAASMPLDCPRNHAMFPVSGACIASTSSSLCAR